MNFDDATSGKSINVDEEDLDKISHILSGAPSNPEVGDVYFNTSDDKLYVYIGEGKEPEWFNDNNRSDYDRRGWMIVTESKNGIYSTGS